MKTVDIVIDEDDLGDIARAVGITRDQAFDVLQKTEDLGIIQGVSVPAPAPRQPYQGIPQWKIDAGWYPSS